MTQHILKVAILVDAKDPNSADMRVYRLLQDACHDGLILNWMYDQVERGIAAMRVDPPIRNARDGRYVENRMLEEYDRLRAIKALTQETTND